MLALELQEEERLRIATCQQQTPKSPVESLPQELRLQKNSRHQQRNRIADTFEVNLFEAPVRPARRPPVAATVEEQKRLQEIEDEVQDDSCRFSPAYG